MWHFKKHIELFKSVENQLVQACSDKNIHLFLFCQSSRKRALVAQLFKVALVYYGQETVLHLIYGWITVNKGNSSM